MTDRSHNFTHSQGENAVIYCTQCGLIAWHFSPTSYLSNTDAQRKASQPCPRAGEKDLPKIGK